MAHVDRRAVLSGSLASLASVVVGVLGGCGGSPPAPITPPAADTPPPLRVGAPSDLLPIAGLRWLILARPREIAAVPWLIPPIATVVPEQNLSRFAVTTGLDLRQLTDAAIASYQGGDQEDSETIVYVARHAAEPIQIERLFRQRLTGQEHRVVERPDLVRVSGRIGTRSVALATLGRDLVVVQQGGSMSRGPVRIATLYATGKLRRSPTVLAEEPLRGLAKRFGGAPARAFALGPFEGELARGARGLLAGATAIGASGRPSAREGIALVVAVAGDFSTSAEAASKELLNAWNELAEGSFGHLLGLDRPVEPPLATHAADAVAVAVELDPRRLATGLHAATGATLEEIMR